MNAQPSSVALGPPLTRWFRAQSSLDAPVTLSGSITDDRNIDGNVLLFPQTEGVIYSLPERAILKQVAVNADVKRVWVDPSAQIVVMRTACIGGHHDWDEVRLDHQEPLKNNDECFPLSPLFSIEYRQLPARQGLPVDHFSEDHICAFDERIQLRDGDPGRQTISGVCWIQLEWSNGTRSACTGTLVAPRLVMTYAECLFDPATGEHVVAAKVLPGCAGKQAGPYRPQMAKAALVRKEFAKDVDRHNGWAALELNDHSIIDQVGMVNIIPMAERVSSYHYGEPSPHWKHPCLYSVGYPKDKPEGTQWLTSTKPTPVFRRPEIVHELDTYAGAAGSPILFSAYSSGEGFRPGGYCVGIHTFSGVPNRAIRLTSAVISYISREWNPDA